MRLLILSCFLPLLSANPIGEGFLGKQNENASHQQMGLYLRDIGSIAKDAERVMPIKSKAPHKEPQLKTILPSEETNKINEVMETASFQYNQDALNHDEYKDEDNNGGIDVNADYHTKGGENTPIVHDNADEYDQVEVHEGEEPLMRRAYFDAHEIGAQGGSLDMMQQQAAPQAAVPGQQQPQQARQQQQPQQPQQPQQQPQQPQQPQQQPQQQQQQQQPQQQQQQQQQQQKPQQQQPQQQPQQPQQPQQQQQPQQPQQQQQPQQPQQQQQPQQPQQQQAAGSSPGGCTLYRVELGDTCYLISQDFGITIDDLEKFNKSNSGWGGCGSLRAGSLICLDAGTAPPLPPNSAVQCGRETPDNRQCPTGACCSAYGFCGNTDLHCGKGCQSNCVLKMAGLANY